MFASSVCSKILSMAVLATLATSSFAQAQAQQQAPVKDEFDQAAPGYDQMQAPAVMTAAERHKKVMETMKSQCDGQGRCWLFGSDGSGSDWQIGFSAGVGQQSIGGTGTVINLGDDDRRTNNDPYYGFNITYRKYNCESNFRVSPAFKELFETYAYGGLNDDGTIKRTFAPTELTLFSLFATLNSKHESCRPNGR